MGTTMNGNQGCTCLKARNINVLDDLMLGAILHDLRSSCMSRFFHLMLNLM
ncbi:hypothetical protein HPP92_016907 [Vanilla planifolia]|uniref:Uncharacterized protein n=1 Tax=Vanilla planifolia TaxID=51239 RepID=A0A835UUM8_VANPL|nr:hypothetical protein HPP92_016907 [Vanilla planifolia]